MAVLLVRYGELALKSPPVRREFERTLGRNILASFLKEGVACRLRSDRGHLYVEVDEAPRGIALLRRIFGVTSVSEVVEVPTERPAIRDALLRLGETALPSGSSFAVRARRTGQHPFTSQELARDLGADVLGRWPDRALRVDLTHPSVELFVEVRGPRTYLSLDRHAGPGGLPLGVAGRVVALVDGRRGALGAYLMMKRGCRCAFAVAPGGEGHLKETLARFDDRARCVPVLADPPEPVLRELIAESRADGVVLPLTVDDYPEARARWGDTVVFSPTVGFDESEVEARWRAVEQLAS